MAHKKAGGSTKNGRDSNPQYLGVKAYGDEIVNGGSIIIRQRGTRYYPGNFVGMGKDNTLFAKVAGMVKFEKRGKPLRTYVNIVPMQDAVNDETNA